METFRVIIVDDDADDQELLLNALEAENEFKATGSAYGYKQLIELLKGTDILPDVILIDLNLPLKNGMEICCELRADLRYRKVVFVLMSEICPAPVIEKSIRDCAIPFLTKPCTIEEFRIFSTQLHEIVEKDKKAKIPGKLLEIVNLLLAV